MLFRIVHEIKTKFSKYLKEFLSSHGPGGFPISVMYLFHMLLSLFKYPKKASQFFKSFKDSNALKLSMLNLDA